MKVQEQKISNLHDALSKLEDKIVFTSSKELADREYAISEIRYYKNLIKSFFSYPKNLQADIVIDLADTIEEVEKWLNE